MEIWNNIIVKWYKNDIKKFTNLSEKESVRREFIQAIFDK